MTTETVIEPAPEGCRIHLHVVPRASRTRLSGLHGGRLKLQVAAPPVEGKANAEIVRFLARTLGVPRAAVTLTAGASGRRKTVTVSGIDAEAASQRLGLPPVES